MTEWFEKYTNIVLLTAWMAQNFHEAEAVAYAVEKPWKFENEFRQAVKDLTNDV